ncbi:MAG: D-glycero-beta-D-manno-heptose-7-phosphate kinase [Nitrospinota bacterium]
MEVLEFLSGRLKRSILVVGDLMLDRYIWGEVERLSPEAPVQVVRWRHERAVPGGAANVAANLKSLGAEVRLLGILGEDEAGKELRRLIKASGISSSKIIPSGSRPTTEKVRILARGQHVLRLDREEGSPITGKLERELLRRLKKAARGVHALVLSDYAKGVLSTEVAREAIRLGKEMGVPVVVDPKADDFKKYQGASLLTPGISEIAHLGEVEGEGGLERAVRRLFREARPEAVLLTRGSDGMTLFEKRGKVTHRAARWREVSDVTGAGDTVVATVALSLAAGLPLPETMELAILSAGLVLGKVGTATVGLEELRRAYHEGRLPSTLKLLPLEELLKEVKKARSLGQKVVFTNGCFDLLHVGHIKLLERARELGDLLIVGLNSDASVRRLKGPHRPIIDERQRAELLCALSSVDYVIIFQELDPLKLINSIKPHVLVKGANYRPEEVVGKAEVESWGGRVELVPLVSGLSTSRLLDQIARRPGRSVVDR